MKQNNRQIDKPLMVISLSTIFGIVAGLSLFPEQGNAIAKTLFTILTEQFGELFLLFGFFSVIILAWLGFGKHGSIKFGEGAPQYSFFNYLAMMICAGLGSAQFTGHL